MVRRRFRPSESTQGFHENPRATRFQWLHLALVHEIRGELNRDAWPRRHRTTDAHARATVRFGQALQIPPRRHQSLPTVLCGPGRSTHCCSRLHRLEARASHRQLDSGAGAQRESDQCRRQQRQPQRPDVPLRPCRWFPLHPVGLPAPQAPSNGHSRNLFGFSGGAIDDSHGDLGARKVFSHCPGALGARVAPGPVTISVTRASLCLREGVVLDVAWLRSTPLHHNDPGAFASG
jgi:hypothetical protein